MKKLKKLLWRLTNLNIGQTLLLRRKAVCPRSSRIHVLNYSLINVSKSALLRINEHGFLDINVVNIQRARIRPCTLWMGDKARFFCEGFTMYEGASIVVFDGASLAIGKNSYMNASLIQCANSITIGDDCAIAGDVLIQDTDFHPILDEERNENEFSKPILIGNHVWICAKAIVLKGVTIGDGAIVGTRRSVGSHNGGTDHFLLHFVGHLARKCRRGNLRHSRNRHEK